jgi:1,4-dihydroxy-2-naphthoyl-CoA hydrolase
MSLWFKEMSLAELNQFGKNTMSEYLDIQFIEIGEDFLKATMPVKSYARIWCMEK